MYVSVCVCVCLCVCVFVRHFSPGQLGRFQTFSFAVPEALDLTGVQALAHFAKKNGRRPSAEALLFEPKLPTFASKLRPWREAQWPREDTLTAEIASLRSHLCHRKSLLGLQAGRRPYEEGQKFMSLAKIRHHLLTCRACCMQWMQHFVQRVQAM